MPPWYIKYALETQGFNSIVFLEYWKKSVFKETFLLIFFVRQRNLLKSEPSSILLNFVFHRSSLLKANSIWWPQLSSQLTRRHDTAIQSSRCFFFFFNSCRNEFAKWISSRELTCPGKGTTGALWTGTPTPSPVGQQAWKDKGPGRRGQVAGRSTSGAPAWPHGGLS